MRRLFLVAALVLAAGSMAPRAAELSARELAAGRKLYVSKCARCHKLYDPAGYPEPEWRQWMTKMSAKAKLKANQKESLARYLDSLRDQSNPSKHRTP